MNGLLKITFIHSSTILPVRSRDRVRADWTAHARPCGRVGGTSRRADLEDRACSDRTIVPKVSTWP